MDNFRNVSRTVLFCCGASQLETWDPKPGLLTGSPFRAIQTDIAGVQIYELMPKMAQRLKTRAVIRSLNTHNSDYGGGTRLMEAGRAMQQAVVYPDLGALIARELGRAESHVPDYVSMYSEMEGRHKGGSVYGKTDTDGLKLEEEEMKSGDLFATIFSALGIDYKKEYHVGARPIQIVDFGCNPATEVLA